MVCSDLGADFGAGARRVVKHPLKRFISSSARRRRVPRLVRVSRKSSKLYTTGTSPATDYMCETMGVAPARLAAAHRACGAAAACVAAGRCCATAIAITFSIDVDPVIRLPLRTFSRTMQWLSSSQPHIDASCWQNVMSKAASWHTVNGPLSATAAIIRSIGWCWVSPFLVVGSSCYFTVDCYGLPTLLVEFRDALLRCHWAQVADRSFLGAGLEEGPDLRVFKATERDLIDVGAFGLGGMLNLNACAGFLDLAQI